MAFAWMILRAAWQPTRVRYKERLLTLQRGQLSVSQRDMARALDRDKAWVERLWKRLKCEAMIEATVEAGVAVITICNYNQYQAEGGEREAARKAPPQAGARQGRGTEQGSKEVKKDIPNGISNGGFAAPQPEWSQFAAHRRSIGKKLSPHAVKLALAKLEALQAEGHDPRKVLEQSIVNGWLGLFPIKDERSRNNGAGKQHSHDRTAAAAVGAFGPADTWTDQQPF